MQEQASLKKLLFVLAIIATITAASTYFILTQTAPKVTGLAAGTATVSVNPVVSLSIQQATVDFGSLVRGRANNTTDNFPSPFQVRNDGNITIDITVSASSFLFTGSGAGNNTNKFRFMAGNVSGEPDAFNWGGSATALTNFTDTNQNVISSLEYNDTEDDAEVEIAIQVPSDETSGNKTADIVFIASQS